MGEGPSAGSLALNVTSAIVTFASAALIFQLGWKESEMRVWRFTEFPDVQKADWSARINSTIHAALVCTLVTSCLLTMSFDPVTLVPLGSTVLLEITFSISIGYFLFDLSVILWYMLPMWTVFVAHHIVALTPYAITQFFYTCHQGQYVLLLFLLVEASTMPLNAMAFLEDLGRRRTLEHRCAHGAMYFLWFMFRVLLPIYLLVLIWTKIADNISTEEACLVPSMVCAHIITLFCVGVFCFLLTPEIYTRIRYGDKDGPTINAALDEPGGAPPSAYIGAMEIGEGGSPSLGAAAGAYHDLGSEGSTPAMPLSPTRNIMSVAKEGPQEMAKAFREGLLPHGDDEGGPGRTGVDKSSAGQMR
eukprot:g19998.t1